VFRLAGRIVTIIALCCAIGLHWMALQSVAWTTMLIENSKHAPLRVAIAQTFDGAHPCSLCHGVSAGKSSERKSDLQSPTQKIDIICLSTATRLSRPSVPFEYASTSCPAFEIGHSPPTPPPRELLG
jgi:hypothetical protein